MQNPIPIEIPNSLQGSSLPGQLDKLMFCLSGQPPPGPNYFRCEHDSLIYFLPPPFEGGTGRIKMKAMGSADWEAVRAVLDEVDVWSWPELFGIRRTHDGLMYYLNLEVGYRKIISSGRIEVDREPDLFEKAMRLHRTFQALAGWPRPQHVNGATSWLHSLDPQRQIGQSK